MKFRALSSFVVLLLMLLAAGCSDSIKSRSQGIEELDANKRSWDDGVKVAESTGRIALSGPVMNLQAIRRDLDAVKVSECLAPAKQWLASAQDDVINGFLQHMSGADAAAVLSMASGRALIEALYERNRSLCLMSKSDADREIARREKEAAEKKAKEEQEAKLEKVRQEREAAAAAKQALASIGEMVTIAAGSFLMGTRGGHSSEAPQHNVTIAKPFALGKYEVTFDAYDAYAKATGRELPGDEGWGRGNRPVINVSWNDAAAYAKWLSEQTGRKYRLPTEAEWEYAARAGSSTNYSWGEDVGRNRGNCDGCGSEWDNAQTAPVGSFAANAFGLHDMHGNVSEWVQDCWQDSYGGAPLDGSARTSCADMEHRVLRGGSWDFNPSGLRSADRFWWHASFRYFLNGFRLAQDLE